MTELDEATTVFLEESFEGIGRVETMLLEIESGAAADDRLNALFRDLHTIKGTSSFLDLKKIEAVAHASEDVLGKLRDGSLALSTDMVTVFLEVADVLRTMLNHVKSDGTDGELDVSDLVGRVRAHLGAQPLAKPNAGAEAAATAAQQEGPPLRVLLAHGDLLEGNRIAALLKAHGAVVTLAREGGEALGKLRALRPTDPPLVQDIALLTPVLPRIDGVDLASRYFGGDQPTPKLPFVFLVGSKEEGEAVLSTLGQHPVEFCLDTTDGKALLEQCRQAVRRAKPATTVGSADAVRSTEETTIRVGVGLLDQLMNLVGELVLARNQILQVANSDKDARANVMATAQRLNIVTSELQEQVMRTRMQPISRLFDQVPRIVRSISKATGKDVVCQVDGNATELDRTFIELVRDPLMHIVRNAIDHGLEPAKDRKAAGKAPVGLLRVRAYHEGGSVNIEVEDDGRGLDPKKLRTSAIEKGVLSFADASQMSDREVLDVIFLPGFSTAASVTNISGRGVGMDVVRTQIERAGGHVEISSAVGRGTTVRLKIPLTLAIVPALLVTTAGQRFAIPQVNVLELVHLSASQASDQIEHVRGAEIFRLRGTVLPLLRLSHVLRMPEQGSQQDGMNIVVVSAGDRRYGLLVDGVHDTVEIVVKPMHRTLKRLTCYSGATILGDGSLALILDVLGIAARCNMKVGSGRSNATLALKSPSSTLVDSFLVFRAGDAQCAVPLSMVSRIERVPSAKIERVAGKEVLQYRSTIMPVIRLEALLGLGQTAVLEEQPLVVFDFGRPLAVAVNDIVDIVESGEGAVRTRDGSDGVLGSEVLLGKTTLLIDVFGLVKRFSPTLAAEGLSTSKLPPRVLVVDDSLMMRSVVGGYLRSAGYEPVLAGDAVAARILLDGAREEGRPFSVLVTDVEMPGADGLTFTRTLRSTSDYADLPILIVSKHDPVELHKVAAQCGATGFVQKLDRSELLAAIASALPSTKRSAA